MALINIIHAGGADQIAVRDGETLLETLRRENIPVFSVMLFDADDNILSLSDVPDPSSTIIAYTIRNPDMDCVRPSYSILKKNNFVAELFRPQHNPKALALVQYNREDAFKFIYERFSAVVDAYCKDIEGEIDIQVSLSAGGDSRVLAECCAHYMQAHKEVKFSCITIGAGIEDEVEILSEASKIAKKFGLDHISYTAKQAAEVIKSQRDVNQLIEDFKTDFPQDEPEILATYWLQQVNLYEAQKSNRKAIIFGYNQEDIITEKLYQALAGKTLPSYPIRSAAGVSLIAPLGQIPKNMLDAMDIKNSLRNYKQRPHSVSYLRSVLYFVAYSITEKYPALAESYAGNPLQVDDPDSIWKWLHSN